MPVNPGGRSRLAQGLVFSTALITLEVDRIVEKEKDRVRRKDRAKLVVRTDVKGNGDSLHWFSVSVS